MQNGFRPPSESSVINAAPLLLLLWHDDLNAMLGEPLLTSCIQKAREMKPYLPTPLQYVCGIDHVILTYVIVFVYPTIGLFIHVYIDLCIFLSYVVVDLLNANYVGMYHLFVYACMC